MKLPPLDLTKGQKFWLWAIGIGIALAPIAYLIRFFYYPISSNSADWGTFGDFIGGILNPIIALLTLIVTIIIALTISDIEKRRHDEAMNNPVKPFLILKTSDFFTSYRSGADAHWDAYYFAYKPPEAVAPGPLEHFTREFYLKVSNRGLGPATSVSVTYEIDLAILSNLLAMNEPTFVATPAAIQTDSEDQRQFLWFHVNEDNGAYQGNSKIWAKETYWVGLVQTGKKVKAPFPSQLILAFKLFNKKRTLNAPLEDFPAIKVTFTYKNINGKDMCDKFLVGLVHIHDYDEFSVFRLLHKVVDD